MNVIKRLERLEVKHLQECREPILIQVIEKQGDEIVVIDQYYLNERGIKYEPY
jgi:hypothetical protein